MDTTPILILIMGLPATGKTTLSQKISEELELPLISRDVIKVKILDSVGWGDREWSKKVGQASYGIIDYVTDQIAKTKRSFILESDFNPSFATERFQALQQEGYTVIQIICTADEETILQRWQDRAANDPSHPSSTEGEQGLGELRAAIAAGSRQPLALQGDVIYLDTSDVHDDKTATTIAHLQDLLSA